MASSYIWFNSLDDRQAQDFTMLSQTPRLHVHPQAALYYESRTN